MITVIFYSLQLSANGQVEQLSAFALTGENFSAVIKTTIRATQSPNLKVIPPEIFDVIAEDLTAAITRFLQWTRMVHSMRTRGNQEMNNILLTAHGGACGDHVYLIRAMLACGIEPPHFRLADSVALHNRFSKQECLERLAAEHTSRLTYLPYSACSTARILRAITISQFPKTTEACYTFSVSYIEFANRTGLGMYGIRELPFFLSDFLENALN
ncbi:hypothetical protein BO82DRAFT_359133 [Aspergillus uvarum CBS 121591]|uniref:Uncharacterized protein n=1 Tax=Aspergillus uvarum CBS 121591 TaxID=1448315 RepID=A0A319BS74_9EURO|nr:hypothetical protein BO82DRAFT_359133 [Aspergillus uvarum CBS 121591]PYH76416.1 hypothetical protein BO82DRAFT_359133 [Aspergillus uvarum CBS 121591]